MDSIAHHIGLFGSVILGNDNRSTGGKADEKADQKVDDGRGRTAHCRQRLFPKKAPYNHGICRIIELLEEGSK